MYLFCSFLNSNTLALQFKIKEMKFYWFIGYIICLFSSQFLIAQTEFAAGTITEIPLNSEYKKTGFGFDFKYITYPSDVNALRLSTSFLSYPSRNTSLLGTAVDQSYTSIDSILIDTKIRRQSYRLSFEYLHFLNGGYNYDMNFYTITGLRLIGTNQRYRKEDYDDTSYQIPAGQERNGFDLGTQLNIGLGYEIAIDFFDFVYLEIDTGIPLFMLKNTDEVENMGLTLGINFGFRTNFGY